MAVESFPIYNFNELNLKNSNSIINSLKEFGYLYINNLENIISANLFRSIKDKSKEFFELSDSIKMDYYIGNSTNHRGYVPTTEKGNYSDEKIRIFEAFDMSYNQKSEAIKGYDLVGPNIYPKEINNFKKTFEEYYSANLEISKIILNILAIDSDLHSGYFDEFLKCPASQLRLLHFKENDILTSTEDISMGAHTDYEIFTIIYQVTPGLQVFDRIKKRWVDMPVFKNSLLLITGDMLDFMTNNTIKSLPHRVSINGEERYSFPFFMNLDFNTTLNCLPKYGGKSKKIIIGHHLLGQLYNDFPYIKNRIDTGKWAIDFEIPNHNKFTKIG